MTEDRMHDLVRRKKKCRARIREKFVDSSAVQRMSSRKRDIKVTCRFAFLG